MQGSFKNGLKTIVPAVGKQLNEMTSQGLAEFYILQFYEIQVIC